MKTIDWELTFIILSVLVTGGLAINAHLSKRKTDKTLIDRTNQIMTLQGELQNTSNDLVGAQKELIKYSTGGDGFGSVTTLSALTEQGGTINFFYFQNHSEYPLYDVKIRYFDAGLIDQKDIKERGGRATVEDLKKYNNEDLGTISSYGGATFGPLFYMEEGERKEFGIRIGTRNKSFSQRLILVKSGESILKAVKLNTIKVAETDHVKILIDTADIGFPGSIGGKILWD